MRTEFQFRKVEKSGRQMMVRVASNVNTLSATGLYSKIWLKKYVLCYVTFATIEKKH